MLQVLCWVKAGGAQGAGGMPLLWAGTLLAIMVIMTGRMLLLILKSCRGAYCKPLSVRRTVSVYGALLLLSEPSLSFLGPKIHFSAYACGIIGTGNCCIILM